MLYEPIVVTLLVVDALDKLGAPYMIVGSLASAVYGVVRTTIDADIVADLRPEHALPLAQTLGDAFYVSVEAIRDAICRQSSFNVIHLETMFKVDVFIPKPRPFDRIQFDRRVEHVVATDPRRTAYITSPEDTVLAKLEWYRLGGETSERQWRDTLGMLKIQEHRMDIAYLRQWAAVLGISDLMEKALAEAGVLQCQE